MNKYARAENFASRTRTPLLREHFVYRAYDHTGGLLYVGCSRSMESRAKEHKTASEWFDLAASFKIAGPFNYETARELERIAIATERPLYNVTPERRAVAAAHVRIYKRIFASLDAADLPFIEAHRIARERANRIVRDPGTQGPWRCQDGDVMRAKRADRKHASQVGAA